MNGITTFAGYSVGDRVRDLTSSEDSGREGEVVGFIESAGEVTYLDVLLDGDKVSNTGWYFPSEIEAVGDYSGVVLGDRVRVVVEGWSDREGSVVAFEDGVARVHLDGDLPWVSWLFQDEELEVIPTDADVEPEGDYVIALLTDEAELIFADMPRVYPTFEEARASAGWGVRHNGGTYVVFKAVSVLSLVPADDVLA